MQESIPRTCPTRCPFAPALQNSTKTRRLKELTVITHPLQFPLRLRGQWTSHLVCNNVTIFFGPITTLSLLKYYNVSVLTPSKFTDNKLPYVRFIYVATISVLTERVHRSIYVQFVYTYISYSRFRIYVWTTTVSKFGFEYHSSPKYT